MSDAEPEADFASALTELIRIFKRKGTADDEIAVALEEAAITMADGDDDFDEPEGSAA